MIDRMRFAFVSLTACVAACMASGASQKPNLVFILADDLGYGDLGCFGQEEIATPHLDRMAAEGTRFTQAYAGSTVCAPSRCVLMTGLHTGHATVRANQRPGMTSGYFLDADDITIARILQDAGYATAAIGKWGLGMPGIEATGLPERQGFDYFFGYLNQSHAHNSYPSHLFRNTTRVNLPNTVPDEQPNGTGVSDNKAVFAQDLFIDEALRFLRTPRDEPFFLYFAPTLPHANNESRPFGLEIPNYGFYEGRDWPEAKKAFAAMVSRLDHDVGRILEALRDPGLAENTLVIFSSDNGPHKEGGADPELFNSSGAFQGHKRSLHEGGIRAPTIAWQPGVVPAGRTSDAIWYFPDVLPTFAAAAGVEPPRELDGVNVLPTFHGETQPELSERLLYWEFHERGFARAVRLGPWKAIQKSPDAPLELYNVVKDPGETHDLARAQPAIAQKLGAAMKAAHTPPENTPVAEGD
ncbi:MAG: arylsulfatase [Opitutaceae bacterium]